MMDPQVEVATAGIGSVIAALGAIAGLIAIIYQTYFSGRATWERRYEQLRKEYHAAEQLHRAAVAGGQPADQLYARWRVCATELARHRDTGQRAGYLR
jgi:hypothetical protein